MNTATVEEVQVKSAQQGLVSNSEKEEQGERADSSDSKAQSFPSDKEVSPGDVPSTNKDNRMDFLVLPFFNLKNRL